MIMEKTGMTWNEIIYKRSWANIRRCLADSPRLVRGKQNSGNKKIKGLDEI